MPNSQPECFEHLKQRYILMQALLEELELKPLDQIKPKDLCERCNMSRSAFYRCFAGVKDIGAWYQRYTSEIGLHQIGVTLPCIEGHRISLELIARAQDMYKYYSNNWNQEFSLSSISGQVESMKSVLEAKKVTVDKRMRYILEGVAYSSHHTVSNWISRNMDVSPQELADIIVTSFYPKELRDILDAPLNPANTATLLENIILSMA